MNDQQRAEIIAAFENWAQAQGSIIDAANAASQATEHVRDLVFADVLEGDSPARLLFGSPVTGQIETGENVWGVTDGRAWWDASPFGKLYGDKGHYHPAADLNLDGFRDAGRPVYAAADGVVRYAGKVSGWQGEVVVIEHVLEDGLHVWTQYAHIDRAQDVVEGLTVKRGAVLGHIADYTPKGPSGDHLHYAVARIDLGKNPGDWPGSDLARVKSDYFRTADFQRARSR